MATITVNISVPVLAQIDQKHGSRSTFFKMAAYERLGWKRWIKIGKQVYDSANPGKNPLANFKQIQKWRMKEDSVEAIIFWSPSPDKIEDVEKVLYFTPGTARTGKLIQWPL